jgi:hypothetical protein
MTQLMLPEPYNRTKRGPQYVQPGREIQHTHFDQRNGGGKQSKEAGVDNL